ncbi:MAG TPA: TolC family protein [Longimicrobiales bacterium]|nr:TolC family protein [Longimicrobiales bacterium]
MRSGTVLPLLAALVLMADTGHAQQAPATLSMDDALQLARRHNPGYQMQVNDEPVANWQVRAAYGALLPSFTVAGGVDWQAGGIPNIGLLSGEDFGLARTPDYFVSGYRLVLNLNLSGSTFFRMAQERASREATRARIDAAAYALEADVSRAYLTALRARDAVSLATQELESAREALRLAEARHDAGSGTRLDVAQAEVEAGRAEVSVLQARSNAEMEKLRLLQRLGLDAVGDVELTTALEVFEPTWSRDDLTNIAMQQHPQLVSARAAESASRAAARSARMSYLPSVSFSGGWTGQARTTRDEDYLIDQAQDNAENRIRSCEATNDLYARLADPLPPLDCSRYAFTAEMRDALLAANDVFPFDFAKRPPSFGMTISMPIFNGFTREAQMQQASAAAEDARHQRREEELNRRTTVATSYVALQTAYLSVAIEDRNVAAAAEQLELARERYRLGAGSILELTQAQATKARADQARLTAIYAFHENLAALEAAVGRRLRP